MRYLLDTDTCIYAVKKKPEGVISRVMANDPEEIAISTITLAEMEYGIHRSRFPDRNRIALLEFLLPFAILDFDRIAAVQYGLIRRTLEFQGTPIGPMDMLLVSQARAHRLILVTNNEGEFRRIEDVEIENWVRV